MIFCLLQWTIVLLQPSNEEVKQKLKDDQQAQNANKEAAMQRIVAIARKLDDDNGDGVAMAPKVGVGERQWHMGKRKQMGLRMGSGALLGINQRSSAPYNFA
ncbi:hypothetical protein niasHT_020945 [Heterodera trifolii]|uniref:Uncharacterized protein n=1 Tax=Heterodera trifolii TaxID=157864 RepID=A0ABD2KCP5_9BILA